jgi:hypothetical protein
MSPTPLMNPEIFLIPAIWTILVGTLALIGATAFRAGPSDAE